MSNDIRSLPDQFNQPILRIIPRLLISTHGKSKYEYLFKKLNEIGWIKGLDEDFEILIKFNFKPIFHFI